MTPSQLARFMAKVIEEPNSGCWLWNGGVQSNGYGMFFVGPQRHGPGAVNRAHRVSYAHFVGPIPNEQFVCHRCDVPSCVNPRHLFIGTNTDNIADMVAKGRHGRGAPYGERHGRSKLRAADVRTILLALENGDSKRAIARAQSVDPRTIQRIADGTGWRHINRAGR